MTDSYAQLRERFALILAVAATTLWLLMAAAYVEVHGGFVGLLALAPFELAVLVAAVAAPVAALWLLMAALEQRRVLGRLAQKIATLAALSREAASQVAETRRLALQDMASSAAVLAERLGVLKRDAAAAAWARYGAGDGNVFVQSFLSFAGTHPDIATRMAEAVARDAVAAAALGDFVRRYEGLVAGIGGDELAGDIFATGALGRAYRLFRAADEQARKLIAAESPPNSESQLGESEPADTDPAWRRLAKLSERLEGAAPEV